METLQTADNPAVVAPATGAVWATMLRCRRGLANRARLNARYRRPMDLDRLRAALTSAGEPDYRARQVWRWTVSGAGGYDEMTNVPAGLRQRLAEEVPFSTLTPVRESRVARRDREGALPHGDGHPVEAVLMRYRDGRRSICLSSQSGCPLTCTFCATGSMQFGRNLTPWEILDQALHFRRIEPLTHCVFMGMGEPMLNLDSVVAAAQLLPDVGITHRRTTVSTVGWVPACAGSSTRSTAPVRLALSLHAPDDDLRSKLMPVNDRYPLAQVVELGHEYHRRRRLKVFVEYVLLAGVNDRPDQAAALADLLDPKVFKVNLIPYNPTGAFAGSSRPAIDAFKSVLDRRGLPATVRLTRGRDIEAACGQLAAAARQAATREGRARSARAPSARRARRSR